MHRDKQPPQTGSSAFPAPSSQAGILVANRSQSPAASCLSLNHGWGWAGHQPHDALEPSQGRNQAALAAQKLLLHQKNTVRSVERSSSAWCSASLSWGCVSCRLRVAAAKSHLHSSTATAPAPAITSFSVGFEVHTVSQPLCQCHTLWLTGSQSALRVKTPNNNNNTTTHFRLTLVGFLAQLFPF